MNSITEEPQSAGSRADSNTAASSDTAADSDTGADRETAADRALADSDMGADRDPAATQSRPPLRRPVRGRMLAGVAAGIAQHFDIDVTIVRIVFAVLTVIGFTGLAYLGGAPLYLGGIPLYLACWLFIPEQGSDQSIGSTLLRNAQRRSR